MAARTQGWSKVKFANGADEYQEIGNNVTNSVIGAGRSGDYLEGLLLVVTNASNCQVTLRDGAGITRVIFPNSPGAGVGTYPIPIGWAAVNNWNISMPLGVHAFATGLFTK